MGYLILRGASRLDAFSVYPVPTWLPCDAFGNATGTPEELSLVREDRDGLTSGVPVALPNASQGSQVGTG